MKYQIDFSCGHRAERQLYGPNRERERYIEWAGREGSCPDCYREAKRAEDRELGPAFVVRETRGGVEFACWRESYPIRETLRARGYRFGEVYSPDPMEGLMRGPRKGWSLVAPADSWVRAEMDWIEYEGYEYTVQGEAARLFAAAVEGRPDLMGGE
jgi:hypothetical protein